MSLEVGMILIIPNTGPAADIGRAHRCIVVKADTTSDNLYLVPVCSAKFDHDKTCVIEQSEWRDILSVNSYIQYEHAKIMPLIATEERISKEIKNIGFVPPQIMCRILSGIDGSDETPDGFRKAFVRPAPPRRVLQEISVKE